MITAGIAPAQLGPLATGLGTLLALCYTPGIIGNNWAMPHLAASIVFTAWALHRTGRRLRQLDLGGPAGWLLALLAYMLLAHAVIEPHSLLNLLVQVAVVLCGILHIATLVQTARPRDIALAFVAIHTVPAVSNLIWHALRAAHLDGGLTIAVFQTKGYDADNTLVLPCSLFYQQQYTIAGVVVPRAIGLYREPGIYQAFGLTAAIIAWLLGASWRWRALAIVLAAGSALALSTAWLISVLGIGVAVAVVRVLEGGAGALPTVLVVLGGCGGLAVVGMTMESFGLEEKLAGESGQDRLKALESLMPSLSASPWLGLGQATELQDRAIQSKTGSMIVGAARLGLIGTALFGIAVWLAIRRNCGRRLLMLPVPMLITLITSQPFYYAVPAYFILLVPWRAALAPRAAAQHATISSPAV